jgi:hypothetical protein
MVANAAVYLMFCACSSSPLLFVHDHYFVPCKCLRLFNLCMINKMAMNSLWASHFWNSGILLMRRGLRWWMSKASSLHAQTGSTLRPLAPSVTSFPPIYAGRRMFRLSPSSLQGIVSISAYHWPWNLYILIDLVVIFLSEDSEGQCVYIRVFSL